MSLQQMIPEVQVQHESSSLCAALTEDFFQSLHHNEVRYIKLKYGLKSKESQAELSKLIMEMVASYTECIDYFGGEGDPVTAYFQLKIKDVNKYYQYLNTQITQTPQVKTGTTPIEVKKALGSISEQTGPQLLPEEDRVTTAVSKQALNHNVMVYLQNQDIKSHIDDNKKKEEKIFTAIAENLKKQDDILTKRKKLRKAASRSRVFLSFSERNLDHSRSSDNSQLIFADLQALQANSPEELKALAERLDRAGRQEVIDFTGEKILQILQDD